MLSPGLSVPIVLIHGWAGSSQAWKPVTNLLSKTWIGPLSAVALPGSPGSEGLHPISIKGAVQVAIEAIDKMPEPAIVIGHSMGAQVSLLTQTSIPDRVLGEVVIDPAYGPEDSSRHEMSEWADRIESLGHEAVLEFFRSAFGPQLPQNTQAQIMKDMISTSPAVIAEYLRAEYVHPASIGLRSDALAAARQRTRPVLSLHSSPSAAAFERELETPAGSAMIEWPGHGHYLHLENPEKFVEQLAGWAMQLTSPRMTERMPGTAGGAALLRSERA